MSAILFGSISSIADTSELQRRAFNDAFAEHGLSWHWDQDTYREMLRGSGGARRIAEYAAAIGEQVDPAAIHATKSRAFQHSLAASEVRPREGVTATIRDAHAAGGKVALVSGTSPVNISALLSALSPAVSDADFDVVVDGTDVEHPKPDKSAYLCALSRLGEEPDGCVAIEDNLAGVQAALAAGIACVAFPNVNTAGHDFDAARRVERVDFAELRALVPAL